MSTYIRRFTFMLNTVARSMHFFETSDMVNSPFATSEIYQEFFGSQSNLKKLTQVCIMVFQLIVPFLFKSLVLLFSNIFFSGYYKTYYYYGKQIRKKICKKYCRNIKKTRKVCVKRCRPAKQKLCRYLYRRKICKSYLHCFLKPVCKLLSSVAQ